MTATKKESDTKRQKIIPILKMAGCTGLIIGSALTWARLSGLLNLLKSKTPLTHAPLLEKCLSWTLHAIFVWLSLIFITLIATSVMAIFFALRENDGAP